MIVKKEVNYRGVATIDRYTRKKFIAAVQEADIIYGHVSLNSAKTIRSRIRKKHLLEELKSLEKSELGFYAQVTVDHKGRKILCLL